MTRGDFGHLLKASMGLDVASVGPSSIEHAVQERLLACALQDPNVYWDRVRASEAELQALIEAVVVPETWFFRDPAAFTALANIGRAPGPRARADGVLHLLSLPSSTGEEPYSMAMALLDAGVPAEHFHIDAFDVSTRALARAAHAVYGKNSFRGRELTFRDRHFETLPLGYRPSEAVRRQVHFRQGNMLAADFLPGRGIYDVIFCRNLLIYFDRPTQDRAVQLLERLLTFEGTLFVAASETGLLLDHAFVSAKIPHAFACRKTNASTPPPRTTRVPVVRRPSTRQHAVPVAVARHAKPALSVIARPIPPPVEPMGRDADLDEASRLADAGRFAEAATQCEEHLRQYGPSVRAFHLIGLVHDATGNQAEASKCYRKALYLDPEHLDTLVHFAFLVERQGDATSAEVLRARARRLEQRGRP